MSKIIASSAIRGAHQIVRDAEDIFVGADQGSSAVHCTHPLVEHADLVGKLVLLVRHASNQRQGDRAKAAEHL